MLIHRKPNQPLTVYLDQMQWINLGRAYHQRPDGVPFEAALQKVQTAVQKKTARFPFSSVHVLETMKKGDQSQRQRLAQVIAKFSAGWTIAQWEKINPVELGMSIPKAFNKPPLLIFPVVFGRGIEFAFGEPVQAESITSLLDSPIELKRMLAIRFLAEILSSPFESLRKPSIDEYNSNMNASADQADQIRKLVRNRDKDTRNRAFTARHMYDFFRSRQSELIAILTPIGLSIEDFFNTLGKDGLTKLFEDMPTTDIMMNLRSQRNNQYEEKISANDLNDLSFLAVAIPYCDIVITEKQWVDLAKRKGFDQKYNTILLSDLAELVNYI
jgi:hypothetical protein